MFVMNPAVSNQCLFCCLRETMFLVYSECEGFFLNFVVGVRIGIIKHFLLERSIYEAGYNKKPKKIKEVATLKFSYCWCRLIMELFSKK